VSTAFDVEIRQGKNFSVSVTADDNIMDLVRAEKKDSTLEIKLDSAGRSINNSGPLKATITMPALEEVKFSGAVSGTVEGFKSDKAFRVNISGASSIKGDIQAGSLDLELTGASTASLKGSAKDAKIHAVGASNAKLGDFALDSANVNLTGASAANINA